MPYTSTIDQETLRERYTAEAAEFYRQKMESIIGNDPNRRHELRGYIPDGVGGTRVELPATLMYRIDTLRSDDGHRQYEFLIECDIDTPSTGIYYGCRGVTVDGFDHTREIEKYRKDREIILPEICQILNNTFPLKDFSHRFKLTDNAQDGTYWLFWLTLNEEEDVAKVGVTATTIMRNVFQRYLGGDKELADYPMPCKSFENERTCFTNDTYKAFLNSIKCIDMNKREDYQKSAEARAVVEQFINGACNQRMLIKDLNYECAFRVVAPLSDAGFARTMYALFEHLYNQGLIQKGFKLNESSQTIQVPWKAICKVFLDKDGHAYQESIRTQVMKIKQDEDFEKVMNERRKEVAECLGILSKE